MRIHGSCQPRVELVAVAHVYKSTSPEVNGEYHRIESREHRAQTDVFEETQTKWFGKFSNFQHNKKICINKEVDDVVYFCHKKETKKAWCQIVTICPKMPFCVFVTHQNFSQTSRAGFSIDQAPWAEVCGKVALHL